MMATLVIVYALLGDVSVMTYEMPSMAACKERAASYNAQKRIGIGSAKCLPGKLTHIKKG